MNKMKELRTKMGISMREAASRLSMPYTTYVNYEKGAREPNSETLILIARFFGVTIDYLLGKETKMPTADSSERKIDDDDIKFALFGDAEIDDELYEEVKAFARFAKERKEKRSN